MHSPLAMPNENRKSARKLSTLPACCVDMVDCQPSGRIVTAEPLGLAGPGRLIDGLLDTEWRSADGSASANQIITLDLGEPTCVTSITVRWAGQNSAAAYSIAASTGGTDFVLVRSIAGYSTTITNRMDRTTASFNRTRFIKLMLTDPGSNTYYSMREIQWESNEATCDIRGGACRSFTSCGACIAQGCGWCKDAETLSCGADRIARCVNGSSAHVSNGPLPRATLDQNFCDDSTPSVGPAAGSNLPHYSDTTFPTLHTPIAIKSISNYTCAAFTAATDETAAAASSALNFNYEARRAFDGILSATEYANVWIAEEGLPQWISYNFENRTAICGYAFSAKPVAPWLSPRSWELQGSNDGYIWWPAQAIVGEVDWAPQERRVYTLDEPVAYSHYRFFVTAAETGEVVSLQEIEIMSPLDECIAEEYETTAPTSSTDRVCTPARQCLSFEYETAPPREFTNRECAMLTICNSAFEYEIVPPTATTDRNCTDLTVCSFGNYERVPPTATTDRECTSISGPTVSVKEIFSDAIELRWTEPTLDRRGFAYIGFTVYVDGMDSVGLHPQNNFTQSIMLYQTIRGLNASTSYRFTVTAHWQTFGESMLSNELEEWTGPTISPHGFASQLYNDAMMIEFTRPDSQYSIRGWRIYARPSPYLRLEDHSCGGYVMRTSQTTASGVCEQFCENTPDCCGFRWMKETQNCQLVANCSTSCSQGCDGNFFKKKIPLLVSSDIRDVFDLHPSNDFASTSRNFGLMVSGLAAGTSYDLYVAARILHPTRGLMFSLAADGYDLFTPTFQQVTSPPVLSTTEIRVTGLWADAIQIEFDEPWVPDDVSLDGYKVFYGEPDSIGQEQECIDLDFVGSLVNVESAGMDCSIMAEAFSCAHQLMTTTLAAQCCTSCAGFQYYPDKPDSNSLDLAQACGHCGVLLPRTPSSMYVRGLSAGTRFAFKLIPIITDGHLQNVLSIPQSGLLSVPISFEQMTAPGPLTAIDAIPTGFDSVALSWDEIADLESGTTVVGYRIFYRISCTVSIPYVCQTENPITLRPQDDACTATYCGDFIDTVDLTTSKLEVRNDFLAAGPVTEVNITGLPGRQIFYDFLVFPILVDVDGVETDSLPYDGPAESRPFFQQRTVDVPGMPTAVVAQPSDARVLLFFTPPTDTGGVDISGYTVVAEAVQGGDFGSNHSLSTIAHNSPVLINSLQNGVAYVFRVSAANEFGEGEISDASAITMPYKDCSEYVAQPFANATCEGGNRYQAVCDNHCRPGFAPHGSPFYRCLSTGFWEGDFNCTDIDECQSSPCLHGAVCNQSSDAVLDTYRDGPMVPYDAYVCYCTNGFEGINCADYTSSCNSAPCQNGGTCISGQRWEYSCACDQRFRGENCDLCVRGWEGADCSQEVDECISAPCFNGGTCFDSFNAYVCHCPNGFADSRCEVNIDDCASMPCNGNGECHDRIHSYECACLPGYISENCEVRVVVCDPDDNQCNASAACWYNGPFIDPQCYCNVGFNGDGRRCEDIDECASSPCYRGNCTESNASDATYRCTCDRGWIGVNCDVETYECESSPCAHNGICEETTHGYSCECQPGYSGDNCETNIDDCSSNPCSNGANCTDHVRSWSCDCSDLRQYTGEACDVEIDYCALGTDDCDRQHSDCVYVSAGNYTCDCDSGYRSTEGGRVCIDIDECQDQNGIGPCSVNGTASCIESTSDPTILPSRYECICIDGVTGALCDIDIDECVAEPCQNGGTCTAMDGFYECTCAPGWYSYNCEIEIDECRSNPCKHGSCTDVFLGFRCACDAGWTGDACHLDIDECLSSPCSNGATCDDLVDAFLCTCSAGYEGSNCTISINECVADPCQNAGLCLDMTAEFACSCPAGYNGKDCSLTVNPCDSHLDLCDRQNSRCIFTGPGTYSCECSAGWNGTLCDIDIESPLVECVSNFTVTNDDGMPHASIQYEELLPTTVTDNAVSIPSIHLLIAQQIYDANYIPIFWEVVREQFLPGESFFFQTGTSEVVITATDAAGHQDTCYTRVHVLSPTLTVRPMVKTLVNDRLILRPSGEMYLHAASVETDSAEGYIAIENSGTAVLWIDELIMDVYWAFLFKDSVNNVVETPIRILPGESYSVGIFFEGPLAQTGFHTGTLHIQSNDPKTVSPTVDVQSEVSRLEVLVEFHYRVSSATAVVLTQPQTIPQLVLAPMERVVLPLNIYNVRNTTVHWKFQGCVGNYYWLDVPRPLPTPWGVGSGGGVDVLPICEAILETGASSESQLYIEGPHVAGLYQASIPIIAMEGNGTANITEVFASNASVIATSTWLVGVSIHVLPDRLDAGQSTFKLITATVTAGQEFEYELETVDQYGNQIANSRQQFRALVATASDPSMATSGSYTGSSFTPYDFSAAATSGSYT
eukprot:SAG31_NODE_461_length_15359_cov_8.989253_1_plen_2385_part_10